mmetsp:Transcript_55099/g.178483  ORF Transcript_55099/g.178483 Transcript_55099/m.178483 type:complete len:240 (-) Transcript_55099:1064-1783(-)
MARWYPLHRAMAAGCHAWTGQAHRCRRGDQDGHLAGALRRGPSPAGYTKAKSASTRHRTIPRLKCGPHVHQTLPQVKSASLEPQMGWVLLEEWRRPSSPTASGGSTRTGSRGTRGGLRTSAQVKGRTTWRSVRRSSRWPTKKACLVETLPSGRSCWSRRSSSTRAPSATSIRTWCPSWLRLPIHTSRPTRPRPGSVCSAGPCASPRRRSAATTPRSRPSSRRWAPRSCRLRTTGAPPSA